MVNELVAKKAFNLVHNDVVRRLTGRVVPTLATDSGSGSPSSSSAESGSDSEEEHEGLDDFL